MTKTIKNDITKWLNHEFESSSGLTPEFAEFARYFKREIKKRMIGYDAVRINRGHFFISGFFKNVSTGKFIYFSISDVRDFPRQWHDCILIRTAKDDRDYTGGHNCFVTINTFRACADQLTK